MMLERFIEQNTGKLVNFDGTPDNAGQSPQLIAAWCRFIGLPYQWANAYDWWDGSDETFTEHWQRYDRPQSSNELPSPGDIVVFSRTLPGSDGCGHLSLFVEAHDASEWIGFDANWGGKSAHLQSHNWAYVIGWFTPINRSVLEAFVPTPISFPTESDPFDIKEIEPQTIVIKEEQAPRYNLNDVSWNSFNINALSYLAVGSEFVATAIAKHRFGGTFYMPDSGVAEGFAIEHCEQQLELEVIEPLAPSNAKVAMRAPHYSPSRDDKVKVRNSIPKYGSYQTALSGTSPIGQFTPGDYFVFKRLNGMMSITSQIGVPTGHWINPADLEPKTVPDWHNLQLLDEPRYFVVSETTPIVDLDRNKGDLSIKPGQQILIAGFFPGPDGKMYGAPAVTYNADVRQWYGIERDHLRIPKPPEEPRIEAEPEPAFIETPPWPFHDKIKLVVAKTQKIRRRLIQ